MSGTQYQGWKYVFTGYRNSKYPKPKFIWKKDGQLLRESERISISEEGNLYIAQLSLNDAGKYSCEVQLSSLRQTRETIDLQIASMFLTSFIQLLQQYLYSYWLRVKQRTNSFHIFIKHTVQ